MIDQINVNNQPQPASQSAQWPDDAGAAARAEQTDIPFYRQQQAAKTVEEPLFVSLAGFEGPLDLLLELARRRKVDLTQISILSLVEQYLIYIDRFQKMRIEIAADYLVMAAWLIYLKSRLLIPAPVGVIEELQPEELAAQLTFRLKKLEAMRKAAEKLKNGIILGRDVFRRGAPEILVVDRKRVQSDLLIDLLKAYITQRQKRARRQTYRVMPSPTWSIVKAREILCSQIANMEGWQTMDHWLEEYFTSSDLQRSLKASSFTASLELAREGIIELRQMEAFQPLYIRRRQIGFEHES